MIAQNPTELLETVDLLNSAVLVIDIQNDFCHNDGCFAKAGKDVSILQNTTPKVEEFLTRVRWYQAPIIHIRGVHSKWSDSPSWRSRFKTWTIDGNNLTQPGSWGAEFYKVFPQPDEYIITKHRYSAFVNTELDLVLRSLGIRTIIVTGFSTNACVQNTAVHGFMKDYYAVVLDDCTAALSTKDHEIALAYMEALGLVITTSETVIEAWRISKKR